MQKITEKMVANNKNTKIVTSAFLSYNLIDP